MLKMRAKMKVVGVREQFDGPEHAKSAEDLTMNAVCASSYPSDGSDEDNTFSRWTPNAGVNITIANPALFGKLKLDDVYYVDFTPVSNDKPMVITEIDLPETGKVATCVTPERIDEVIVNTDFYVFPGTTLTVCCLTLKNGTKVVGQNYGAIDVARQNWETGRREARAMAIEKVWELEGYALRERLASPVETD